MRRYIVVLFVFTLLYAVCSYAEAPGIPEMRQATQDLKKTFFSAINTSLVLAGIFGIAGAIRIYNNWQLGKHHFHVDFEVAAWFSASLFAVLMGAFLRALFGI